MSETGVYRVIRRKVRRECAPAYEALIAAMFEDAKRFPGYLAATLLPPETEGGEYQINQRFASEADLERWNRSPERLAWLEKLAVVSEGPPDYQLFHGLEVWFAPVASVAKLPVRWRMTVVSWLGIFPTVSALLIWVAPALSELPFLARTAIITALVAVLMSYVIMPRLTRWFGSWLRR